MGTGDEDFGADLFSGLSDIDYTRQLLGELFDDLGGKVARLRQLADLGGQLGRQGTMLFGGAATFGAWAEARSSFVHGNYVATVLLCQSLVENLLAAYLHSALTIDASQRVSFRETLKRCLARNLITGKECDDLERLMALRNPLTHFRTLDDEQNLDRRAMATGLQPDALVQRDASFAIGLAVRMLAKPQFRLG